MVVLIQRLASENQGCVETKVIGYSVEKRPLYMVTINDQDVDKPIIFLEGGMHSREWIGPATLLHNLEALVNTTCPGRGQ